VPSGEQLAAASVVGPLTTRHGELHILNEVPGAAPYEHLRARALVIDLDGVELAIAGLEDLILNPPIPRSSQRRIAVAMRVRPRSEGSPYGCSAEPPGGWADLNARRRDSARTAVDPG